MKTGDKIPVNFKVNAHSYIRWQLKNILNQAQHIYSSQKIFFPKTQTNNTKFYIYLIYYKIKDLIQILKQYFNFNQEHTNYK